MSKPTWRDALPLVQAYCKDNADGGSLHLVLDGNLDDGSVDYCLDYAEAQGDTLGMELGQMLKRMTQVQRHKLYIATTS